MAGKTCRNDPVLSNLCGPYCLSFMKVISFNVEMCALVTDIEGGKNTFSGKSLETLSSSTKACILGRTLLLTLMLRIWQM